MPQSRTVALVEVAANTGSGMLIAWAAASVLYPIFGLNVSTSQNAGMVVAMTIVSAVRSYIWRRIFNRIGG